ncbi:MAG: hypothetical protein ACKOCK_10130 [Chloroflexota bacterium]
MVLNNPKLRETLMTGALTANAKVRQQIEAFVQQEVAKATAPLIETIAQLEARIARLESSRSSTPTTTPTSSRRSDLDASNF